MEIYIIHLHLHLHHIFICILLILVLSKNSHKDEKFSLLFRRMLQLCFVLKLLVDEETFHHESITTEFSVPLSCYRLFKYFQHG